MALARTSNVSAGRYEFKYFVPRSAAPALRELLRQFTRPDPHAQLWPGFRYPVLTLYCDSPGLTFYEASARGQKSRLKLRLRRYSELPHAPVYIEVKRRVGDAVVKERERAELHAAAALTAALRVGASESKGVHFGAVAARFLAIARAAGARPILWVRYQREAYEAKGKPAVRVTLDDALGYAICSGDALCCRDLEWRRLDDRWLILEIKFRKVFPAWLLSLVRAFDLQRRPIPKYGLSVSDALLHARPGQVFWQVLPQASLLFRAGG